MTADSVAVRPYCITLPLLLGIIFWKLRLSPFTKIGFLSFRIAWLTSTSTQVSAYLLQQDLSDDLSEDFSDDDLLFELLLDFSDDLLLDFSEDLLFSSGFGRSTSLDLLLDFSDDLIMDFSADLRLELCDDLLMLLCDETFSGFHKILVIWNRSRDFDGGS